MKRRNVLKGLGLSLGYAVATPSILSLFHSCKTESEVWIPQLLSLDEGLVVKNLIDIMLPKTEETPGALDVNIPEFLDLFASKVYNQEQTSEFLNGLSCIMEELPISDLGVSSLKEGDYTKVLDHYLRIKKEQREIYLEEENTVFIALVNLRDFALWAYKTSEQVGKNILVYDPIPSRQQGCISLEEATGGKTWSL